MRPSCVVGGSACRCISPSICPFQRASTSGRTRSEASDWLVIGRTYGEGSASAVNRLTAGEQLGPYRSAASGASRHLPGGGLPFFGRALQGLDLGLDAAPGPAAQHDLDQGGDQRVAEVVLLAVGEPDAAVLGREL